VMALTCGGDGGSGVDCSGGSGEDMHSGGQKR
jgi:hypothetical protein